MKREIDSKHVDRDTVHARRVNRKDFHCTGHPILSLVISRHVMVLKTKVVLSICRGLQQRKIGPMLWFAPAVDVAAKYAKYAAARHPQAERAPFCTGLGTGNTPQAVGVPGRYAL